MTLQQREKTPTKAAHNGITTEAVDCHSHTSLEPETCAATNRLQAGFFFGWFLQVYNY